MSTEVNPRAILAGAAALPATALPAVAEPDPVFAAIEAHRRAHAARAPSCHRRVRHGERILKPLHPELVGDAAE